MTPEVVNAFGELWKLGAIFVLGLALILFRDPLKTWLERMTSVNLRRGENELSISADAVLASPTKSSPEQESTTQEESDDEEVAAVEKALEAKVASNDDGSPGLFAKMWAAFDARDEDGAKAAFKELQRSNSKEPKKLLTNKAVFLAKSYTAFGDGNALEELKKLPGEDGDTDKGWVYFWIGYCHEASDRYMQALEAWRLAETQSDDESDQASFVASRARVLGQLGRMDDGKIELLEGLRSYPSPAAQAALYTQMAEIENKLGNKFGRALAREMVAMNRPENSSARFNAAIAQSEVHLDRLSLTNYNSLLRFDPENGGALNNRGVLLDALDMPARSISDYNRSLENGVALAGANIAYKLLNAGFMNEAREVLDKSQALPIPHENVARAVAELTERPEREENTFNEETQRGTREQYFFRKYYPASLFSEPFRLETKGWRLDGEDVEVSKEEEFWVLRWGSYSSRRQARIPQSHRASEVKLQKWEKPWHSEEWRFDSGESCYFLVDDSLDRITILSTSGNMFLQLAQSSPNRASS